MTDDTTASPLETAAETQQGDDSTATLETTPAASPQNAASQDGPTQASTPTPTTPPGLTPFMSPWGGRMPPSGERFWKTTTFRMLLVGVLILLMLIPLSMVSSVVDERHAAYNGVLSDISAHWGGEQVLTGPILILPCTEAVTVTEQTTDEKGRVFNVQREITDDFQAVLLPKHIALEGSIHPEYRLRGIYQTLVYSEHLTLTGSFKGMETAVKSMAKEGWEVRFHWEKAFVVVGLSDTKGITRIAPFRFSNQKVDFAPGTRMPHLAASGFHAPLSASPSGEDADFSLEMDLKGSTGFRMAPLGELSEMHLTSPWAHPSFYGEILPSKRTVNDNGFDATWSVPHLVRAYPQYWLDGKETPTGLAEFSVGVSLFEPVTIYTEAVRAVKYGILFVALTFLTLALLEIITKSRPSMVQYILIGAAMTLFYLLLIALAEHIGFNRAYGIAAAVVITLNSVYCLFVLSRKALAFVVTAVLSALYAVLFMALRAEDYALLTGSILLVVAVALTMFFTRNLHKQNNS